MTVSRIKRVVCLLRHSLLFLFILKVSFYVLLQILQLHLTFTYNSFLICWNVSQLGIALTITHHREWRQHSNILSLSDNCVNYEYDDIKDNLVVRLYWILGEKLFIFCKNLTFLWRNEDELMWEVGRHWVKRYKLLTFWTGSVFTESCLDLESILLSLSLSLLSSCMCLHWLTGAGSHHTDHSCCMVSFTLYHQPALALSAQLLLPPVVAVIAGCLYNLDRSSCHNSWSDGTVWEHTDKSVIAIWLTPVSQLMNTVRLAA